MSEWDFNEPAASAPGRSGSGTTGSLNVPMAVVCLLAVSAVSFATAWFMKDRVREFWEMGLTFALPFAALMGASMLVESATNRMTPECSRNAQFICVLVTVLASFIFGCVTVVLRQPVVIEHVEPEYDYVLVLDKSGSMVFTDLDEPCRKACHELIDAMEDANQIGIVAFGSDVVGEENIRPLDEDQRKRISRIIDLPIEIHEEVNPFTGEVEQVGDGTGFAEAMNGVIRIIENKPEKEKPIRIILVTDGDETAHSNFQGFNAWVAKQNDGRKMKIELCAIQLGESPMLDMVKEAVRGTDGQIFDHVDISNLTAQLQNMKSTLVIPEPVDTLKATYAGMTADGAPNTPYMILSAVLLVLLGVLSGFSLKLMYSVQGQRRAQVILSPLMGLIAFLLLNFGRNLGITPAWICEGIAFSLFGLVFMRENPGTGSRGSGRTAAQTSRNAGQTGTAAQQADEW